MTARSSSIKSSARAGRQGVKRVRTLSEGLDQRLPQLRHNHQGAMYRERREGHSTGQAVDDDSVYPDGRFPDLPGLYNRVHQSRHALLLLPAPGSAPRRYVFRDSLTNAAWFLRMRPAVQHLRGFSSLVLLVVPPAWHYEFCQPQYSEQPE